MANILKAFPSRRRMPRLPRHSVEGLEQVMSPQIETSAYEFMLENLMDLPTNRFNRWRTRGPQG